VSAPTLHLDFESRSAIDLRKTGAHAYAEDPTTGVWCCAYAVDDEPVDIWTPGEPPPLEVLQSVEEGWPIYAHNASFERLIWRHVMPLYDWPVPRDEQYRCTMVMCHAMALPGALENAAPALGLDVRKDAKGRALMLQMAKPRTESPLTWWDDEEKKQRLYAYCKQDVEVERELHKRLVPLKPSELDLWHLDLKINDRGIYIDETLCHQALKVIAAATERLNAEIAHVTDYAVSAVTNVQSLLTWVKGHGIDVSELNKESLTELLVRDDLPDDVRRALEIRQEGGKASVAKVKALLACKSRDGTAKGLLQFHGANTGRYAARRFQPQNLMRPDDDYDADLAIDAIMGGDAERIELLYGPPLSTVGQSIRGMVVAKKGNRLLASDFSNIEGRGIAWLAGEEWKLDAFRAYDTGTGPDLYKVSAAGIFGVPVETIGKDSKRQIGKVAELALGYQGGPRAFKTMAKGYGMRIEEHYDVIMDNADPALIDEAFDAWETYGRKQGLSARTWLPGEVVKRAWRRKHPAIETFWNDMEAAAIEAVERPGRVCIVGHLKFRKAGSFLWMQLPSGRCLCYPYPVIKEKRTPWGTKKPTLHFMGVNSLTKKWEQLSTYGGKLAENATQAIARDVLTDAMVRLEAAGYPIILTVHDEAVAELPVGQGSLEEFEAIMREQPSWCPGFPIAAEGWEGERYRK
jgi:DNA polymerase